MEKGDEIPQDDESREEYDRSDLKGGIRGKNLEQYRKETKLAKLAPDVRGGPGAKS